MELRVGHKFRLGRKIGSGSFGDIYIGLSTAPCRCPASRPHPLKFIDICFRRGGPSWVCLRLLAARAATFSPPTTVLPIPQPARPPLPAAVHDAKSSPVGDE